MYSNLDSLVDARRRRGENRSAARSDLLTWRAKDSIKLTETIAEQLEIDLAEFAKVLRTQH